MNKRLKIKLAAKRFINNFKNYREGSEVLYSAHVSDYNNSYNYLNKRDKIKFIFDLFQSIIDENYFSKDLSLGIYWELKEVLYIYDFLTPFEIINEYFDDFTPPMITVYKTYYKNKITKEKNKIREINYKNGKLFIYLFTKNDEKYLEQYIKIYYEPKESYK